MSDKAPMSPSFAVFNLHVNDAGKKADAEYIRVFGQKAFDKEIKPYHDEGIMKILSADASGLAMSSPENEARFRRATWIMMVTVLVNERCYTHSPVDENGQFKEGIEGAL